MLKLLCQGKDTNSVAKEISEMYEVPFEQVFDDVTSFVEKLNRKDLI